MRRLAPTLFLCTPALLLFALTTSAQKRGPMTLPPETQSASSDFAAASSNPSVPKQTILVPAGTKISVAVTSPVWSRSAKPGDTIYGVTAFPVVVGDQMAVPAGTSVQGLIDAITRPNWHASRGEFRLHLTELIFANGYFVPLDMLLPTAANPAPQSPATADPVERAYFAARNRVGAAPAATVYLEVSSKSDVLLDNGTQFDVTVGRPLQLDAARIASDVRVAKAPELTQFHSATQCRYIPGTPGTPGTPDTVIPGTPGTPPTVIPGANGAPPTVIPGTPGTPPTVIPGTPGTPGTPARTCPGPPTVTSQPLNGAATMHTESFTLSSQLLLEGHALKAGNYKVTWTGSAPDLQVLITRKNQPDVSASAHLVSLPSKAPANVATPRSKADGSASLQSLQFKGQTLALYFDPPAATSSAASMAAPPGNS